MFKIKDGFGYQIFYKSDGFGFQMTLEIRWLWMISEFFINNMALDFK